MYQEYNTTCNEDIKADLHYSGLGIFYQRYAQQILRHVG